MANKTETMNAKYLPLIKLVQKINSKKRQPSIRIETFWHKYGINDSRLHILNMFLAFKGETIDMEISTEEMERFSHDLIDVLLAYYVMQHEELSLAIIDMPILEDEEEFGYDQMYSAFS